MPAFRSAACHRRPFRRTAPALPAPVGHLQPRRGDRPRRELRGVADRVLKVLSTTDSRASGLRCGASPVRVNPSERSGVVWLASLSPGPDHAGSNLAKGLPMKQRSLRAALAVGVAGLVAGGSPRYQQRRHGRAVRPADLDLAPRTSERGDDDFLAEGIHVKTETTRNRRRPVLPGRPPPSRFTGESPSRTAPRTNPV